MTKKLFKFAYLRNVVFVILFILLAAGSMNYFNFGTFCSYCAAGVFQIIAASGQITFEMVLIVIGTVIVVLIFGRIFCAWGCPSVVIRNIFPKKARGHVKEAVIEDVAKKDGLKSKIMSNGSYIVLGGAVVASFFAGFPVFCLICPIGLFFGFFFAMFNLFFYYDPSWNLIVFPLIIILELILFKKWCGLICPVNGIFKLVNVVFGKRLTLRADKNSCTNITKGGCQICLHNCDENISMPKKVEEEEFDCTLCLHCRDNCPTNSIKFQVKAKK